MTRKKHWWVWKGKAALWLPKDGFDAAGRAGPFTTKKEAKAYLSLVKRGKNRCGKCGKIGRVQP